MAEGKENPKAVVVDGVRTPFIRAFSSFMKLDAIALGVGAVEGLFQKTGLSKSEVDAVVWGGVVLPSAFPNVGREIAIEVGLPATAEAMTVTRACASGLQAVTSAAALIERGEAEVVIAGGGDSTSNVEIQLPTKMVHALAPFTLGKKKGVAELVGVLRKLWPLNELLPRRPQIAERSTGELMGEAAEKMGRMYHITRTQQDEYAVRSHLLAAKAWEEGILEKEVVPIQNKEGKWVERDNVVRPGTTMEKLARLKPAFSKQGELTAGNSSALTDGAAAVLVMSESKALSLGLSPLASFQSWAYVGVDPFDQLLMGPAIAMPLALKRAGLTKQDIGLVDMHEAFAAQVLSVLKMLESDDFAKEKLNQEEAFGCFDMEHFNIYGGSLALGHPFAATGARMVTTMAHALHRKQKKFALLGLCAAGGLGAAAVMERYNPS